MACTVGLAAAALWPAGVRAQQVTTGVAATSAQTVGTPFEMTGFIQDATLDTANDVFSGGSITLNNHKVKVPRNTILQMPATALTWAEVFKLAPAPYGPTRTGLALSDVPKPLTTFEVTVQGNRIGDTYIAGLIFLSQKSLQVGDGYINFIDYAKGELHVGGTPGVATTGARVQLNDAIGRFGRAMSPDVRFTIDEDNPTIKTETAYPMCLPRVDPAVQDDPLCPQGNRPLASNSTPTAVRYQQIFTMPDRPAPTAAEIADPSTRPTPDAWRMAPFEVGDHIVFKGTLLNDGSDYFSVWGIDANVGIFTTAGSLPVYVSVDVLLMGTGPTDNIQLLQEGSRRFRMEGFTTDTSRPVNVFAVDVNPCTGGEIDRFWATQQVDPGPPNGAVMGRWRFRPSAPLFNLKGFPFLPPTREAVAYSTPSPAEITASPNDPSVPISCPTGVCSFRVPTVTTLNGLTAGQYTLPNFDFLLPENRGIGNPKVPANYETMQFLAQGSGPWFGGGPLGGTTSLGIAGQLSPWPGAVVPPVFVDSVTGLTCAALANLPTAQATASAVGMGEQTVSVTTTTANELLVAFGASDGPATANAQTLDVVDTAGLTWTLVRRVGTQFGTSEIWTATAATPGTFAITAHQAIPAFGAPQFNELLTVIAFTNASGVGASNTANAAAGPPTVSLVAQAANSLVFGVGNDWMTAVNRTPGPGQSIVRQSTVAVGDTFWVQRANAPTTAGATVTLSDAEVPTNQWNYAIVEIKR
jgi:hypothetical protein